MNRAYSTARAVVPMSPEARIIREQRERIEELEEEIRQLRAAAGQDTSALSFEKARQALGLRPAAYEYLIMLLQREMVRKDWLMDNLHDGKGSPSVLVGVTIHHLRNSLRKHGVSVQRVWGQGYYLTPEDKTKIRKILETAS